MKKIFLMLGLGLLFSLRTFGQEPNLDMFYGKKDFKGGGIGYEYFLNTQGASQSLELFYLTKSKKSSQAKKFPYYYGISLDFGTGAGKDYTFNGDKGDFSMWWIFLWVEGRIFTQDEKRVRGYVDFGGGLGIGEMEAEGEDFDLGWSQLDLVRLRVGVGVQVMLSSVWAIDFGAGVIGSLGMTKGFLDQADLELAGARAMVSICRWSEK